MGAGRPATQTAFPSASGSPWEAAWSDIAPLRGGRRRRDSSSVLRGHARVQFLAPIVDQPADFDRPGRAEPAEARGKLVLALHLHGNLIARGLLGRDHVAALKAQHVA